MVMLTQLFSLDNLEKAIEEKYVRQQFHSDTPSLAILNYTEKAQYEQNWNSVTLACRGLIYDTESLQVVARPFPKFFNWDDGTQPYPPSGSCIRMDKMDGSLGIMYWQPEGAYAIATRGSFTSDQANHASQFLWEYQGNPDNHFEVKPDRTYLYEIIYPENRIVVNYGSQDKLVLLDVIDNETGAADLEEFDNFNWPDKVSKTLLANGFSDTLASDIPKGSEGFVLYWPYKDYRVKIKSAEYLELHRMIFNLSERSVWSALGSGKSVENILDGLPDEYHDWVKEVTITLNKQCLNKVRSVYTEFNRVEHTIEQTWNRKEWALKFKDSPNKSLLFMLLDRKSIVESIWESLKPAGNKTMVLHQSEDVA